MTQRWRDLLFAHWRIEPALIQTRLPKGLHVDTWRGDAFLGVVPFRMAEVRVGPLPPVPGLDQFLELNLRTYVIDDAGVPGVWFHTLDADDSIAVAIARTCFHLPYHQAEQHFEIHAGGTLGFRSRRRSGSERGETALRWQSGPELPAPTARDLSHFLVERYVLYTQSGRRLYRGRIAHAPYRVRTVDAEVEAAPLFRAHAFTPPATPPDHVISCDGADVTIFGLERIAG
jgi:uncharacterized protein YqjF (DUF2071 family)